MKIQHYLTIVIGLFLILSCSDPSASFTPTTIDFVQSGSDLRYFTNDPARSDTTRSIWYSSYSTAGDFVYTLRAVKVTGTSSNSYGMNLYNAADTSMGILFVISDNGRCFISSWDSSGYLTLLDWVTVSGMTTGINVPHILSADYNITSGNVVFSVDGTVVLTHPIGAGFNAKLGMRCYMDSPSETNPFDYRFRVTSPFTSP